MRPIALAIFLCFTACSAAPDTVPWPEDLPPNAEDGAHFDGEQDPYYEGWYHKVSLPDEDEAFFFIYSVVNPRPDSAYPSEAFVYCGRASDLDSIYQAFPATDYRAASDHRDVRIGPLSRATALRIAGQAEDANGLCRWDIWMDEGLAWPETMGWLTGQAGLETSWCVGTLRAQASGWVDYKGHRYEFDAAPAYGDHNWGRIFPRQWFWMQAHQFTGEDAALAASGGTVDFGDTEIQAQMIGFSLDGQMHSFRTQDLDRVDAVMGPGSWTLDGEKDLERIHIEASCDPDTFFHLLAPTEAGVAPRAFESLFGQLSVRLEQRTQVDAAWKLIFEGTASNAGVEVGLDQ